MTNTRFPPSSRYHDVPDAAWTAPDGRRHAYLLRRFVPDPDRFVTLQEYRVVQSDRLDRLAAATLGDAVQFWRLTDANGCLHPGELEEVGRRIRLTLPEGMQGAGDA